MAAPEDPVRARSLTIAAPLPQGFGGAGRLSAVHAALRLVRIGRAPENDIVVEDVLVSRKHAELRGTPDAGYELVDLGSYNGTFVNGVRIEKAQLEQLDVVGIGHAQFRLVGDSLEEYVDTGEITFEAHSLIVRVDGGVRVDGVGISLRERALLGIVGPSGCGKSTLLHALSGRRPATSGTVLYDGLDLYAHYDELRSRIGFVPQDDVLHRELRLEALLEYSAELAFPPDVSTAERSQRVDEVLRELALEDRRGVRVDRLSGGQRKRVSVALALLTKPSLLFLDEPTSGLDPGYERTLMELLRELADGGRTVVVVTHNVQSLRLCDRTLVLAPGGKPAYFGPPQLAPAYFGRDDLQQVFQELSAGRDVDWAARFREHPDHARYAGATEGLNPETTSRAGIIAFTNGQTGLGNPNRQGLNSTILDGPLGVTATSGPLPLNIIQSVPTGGGDNGDNGNEGAEGDNGSNGNDGAKVVGNTLYSPLWDAHLTRWVPSSVPLPQRTRQTSFEDVQALAAAGKVTNVDGLTWGRSGPVPNCPIISMDRPGG